VTTWTSAVQNTDGTASCDRCGITLAGFGVLSGLVCVDLDGETVRELIFCYANECRTFVLDGFVNYQQPGPATCTHCGISLGVRSVSTAMLATDVQPTGDTSRTMQFCYENGSRNQLLDRVDPTGVRF
jgi:hypothetical protein